MEYGTGKISLFKGVDRVAVLLYIALVVVGLVAIFSASWIEDSENFFSFSHNYIKQAVWIAISLVAGVVMLLLDASLWHKIAYYLYGAAVMLLLVTYLFGTEVAAPWDLSEGVLALWFESELSTDLEDVWGGNCGDILGGEQKFAKKLIINGQLYILRDGKLYDAQGLQVK